MSLNRPPLPINELDGAGSPTVGLSSIVGLHYRSWCSRNRTARPGTCWSCSPRPIGSPSCSPSSTRMPSPRLAARRRSSFSLTGNAAGCRPPPVSPWTSCRRSPGAGMPSPRRFFRTPLRCSSPTFSARSPASPNIWAAPRRSSFHSPSARNPLVCWPSVARSRRWRRCRTWPRWATRLWWRSSARARAAMPACSAIFER